MTARVKCVGDNVLTRLHTAPEGAWVPFRAVRSARVPAATCSSR